MNPTRIIAHVLTLAEAWERAEAEERARWDGAGFGFSMDNLGKPPPPPPPEAELRRFVASLPAALIYLLAVLLYVTRGVCDPRDLLGAYVEVSDEFPRLADAAAEVCRYGPPASWLTEALAILAECRIDLDAWWNG